MNINTPNRIARLTALPLVAAGLLAGALGFASAANAGTYSPDNTPRPGIVATPNVSAPSVLSGTHGHRIDHVIAQEPNYYP